MAMTEPKKYQKIEETEIDLVIKCKDSHEFYEKYMEVFADKKKGIESIGKIWKRRSDFIKKRQETAAKQAIPVPGATAPAAAAPVMGSPELDKLIAAQNVLIGELSAVLKEQLAVSKGISALLQKRIEHHEETHHKQKEPEAHNPKEPEAHDPEKRHKPEKPPSSIVVGS